MKPPKKSVGKVSLKNKKKRSLSSRQWLVRQLNDPYVSEAQGLGYRSRAAFKLREINEKYRILRKGMKVIDLGAAPGGWTQVLREAVKPEKSDGLIIAVDLSEMAPINDVTIITDDFTKESTIEQIIEVLNGKADVVLSDMAAPACGIPSVDHIRIMGLVEIAFHFAQKVLNPKGSFVAKVLQGGTEVGLLNQLKKSFEKVVHFKPPASRKDSAEMYLVALGFKGADS